jgi:hypothetical protein
MGRTDVLSIYLKHGARPLNHQTKSGAVTFELLEASVQQLRGFAERNHRYYDKLRSKVTWDLDFPFFKPACCFHGGAFFDAIGTSFDSLERRSSIVDADVLDAWFPPSPKVLDTMREHLPWLMSTSPPAHSDGLRMAIARYRGVDQAGFGLTRLTSSTPDRASRWSASPPEVKTLWCANRCRKCMRSAGCASRTCARRCINFRL